MSTSPDVFTALPLAVLSDPRVSGAKQEARALGFSAGYAAGARTAAQELEQQLAELSRQHEAQRAQDQESLNRVIAAFASATAAAHARELPVLDEARTVLCTLALELAQSVVGGIDQQPSPIMGVSTGALSALLRAATASVAAADITVAMAPDQAQQVLDHWDLVLNYLGDTAVSVVPDASLSAGSAVATYPNGHVDATLESAFTRAKLALDNALSISQLPPAGDL